MGMGTIQKPHGNKKSLKMTPVHEAAPTGKIALVQQSVSMQVGGSGPLAAQP